MHVLLNTPTDSVLRFDYGEDLLAGLKDFCKTEKIEAASVSALGAAKRVVISYYELSTKTYFDRTIETDTEIAGMVGNVAVKDGAVAIHLHGTFSDSACTVLGGHVKEAIVGASCEVMIRKFEGRLERKLDQEIGLPLLYQP